MADMPHRLPSGTVVVTGAAGYLGSRLVPALVAAGTDVTAIVRRRASYLEGCRQVEIDLSGPAPQLEAALSGASAIVHLAGANEVTARTAPASSLAGAASGTWRIADGAVASGVPRLVYVSTAHVYGASAGAGTVVTEELRPEPRSAYSIARLASEHICFERAAQAGAATSAVCFRVTNSVGAPRDPGVDRWSLVANDLCRQAVVEGDLRLQTNGRQWRDFVHVDDVLDVIIAALDPARLPGGLYNLASGSPMTVLELARRIQDAYARTSGTRVDLEVPPGGPGPVPPTTYSVSKLTALGLAPHRPVQSAIEETLAFCLANRERLAR
jgi:UDP-glucose 4-epimerase